MRGAVGLLSILIAVAIMLYLLAGRGCAPGGKSYLTTVVDAKKKYEPIAQQMGGKDPQGRPFNESLTTVPWPETGKFRGLLVQSVDPAGSAATFYGLQAGDVIEQIGPLPVGGMIIGDEQAGGDFLIDAFARQFPLTVKRNGETLQLNGSTTYSQSIKTPAGTVPGAPAAPGAGPSTPQIPRLPLAVPQ